MNRLQIALGVVLLALLSAFPAQAQNQLPSTVNAIARQGGTFYAGSFGTWSSKIISGNTSTGAGVSIIVTAPSALQDGSLWPASTLLSPQMLNPILVNDNNAETVTPTSISISACPAGNIGVGTANQCATITGTFNNTHGPSAVVQSGSYGVGEAVSAADSAGGGAVILDNAVPQVTNALISATQVRPKVMIEDLRSFAPQFWTPVGGATAIGVPTTLTATTVGFGINGANTTSGTYTGASTYHYCIAYVDLLGQEGACSADFSGATAGTGTTNQLGFSAPAASTGAVGYTIYVSLASGTYQLAYKVPLVTQPSASGNYPVGNGVCVLTTIETTTPACAVANTSYGQTGSAAIVSALTLNTSPIDPQVTTVSTTTVYVPNAGGRTTYTYAPGSHIGTPGLPALSLPFTISAADATTVPSVLGTVNVPPGFMNAVGRNIEVCGKASTSASTATIGSIQFQWDAVGQNTAGKGVQIGNLGLTPATAFSTTAVYTFCEQFTTTVAAATATGGSIQATGGYIATSGVATAAAGQGAGSDPTIASTGSLNLAADARLNVVYVHTTGTDGTALTLQDLTFKVLN